MAETNVSRKNLESMNRVNPLIDSDGDTYKVSSALNALSCLLQQERTMEPDSAEAFGLAVILDTCAAALRVMEEANVT